MLATSLPAVSQTPSKAELEQTNRALAERKKQNAKIMANLDRLEAELGKLSTQVTSVAGNLQSSEQEYYALEQHLSSLEKEYAGKERILQAKSKQLGAMLSTMIRLSRVPQESAILMPAKFTDRMMASRAISLTSQSLKGDMDALTVDLAELKALEKKLSTQRETMRSEKAKLEERREALHEIIDRRKELMDSLHSEQSEQQKSIASLARKANNLQSLLVALEKERQKTLEAETAKIGLPVFKPSVPGKPASTPLKTASRGLPPLEVKLDKGSMHLPVAGSVSGRYGASRGKNDTLRGLEINTVSGAQVVAPAAGEVLYTGKFLTYGQMVIIRHSHQYHTLLAGFSKVDCSPGQRLLAGEPIGVMGTEKKQLYVELRRDGKPIDPLPWLSGNKTQMAGQ